MKLFSLILLLFISFADVFAQAPVSVSVKTASYTIPARKWARVTVEVDSGGVFSIDGVSAVTSSPFLNISLLASTNPVSTYTMPTGYHGEVHAISSNASSGFTYNGSPVVTSPNGYTIQPTFPLGPGGSVSTPAGVFPKNILGKAVPSNATNRQAIFNLPAGVVINGSGSWRAVVELYER